MKLISCENYDDLSKKASDLIVEIIKNKKDAVLGLATGSTPIGVYQNLVRENEKGNIDFSNVRTVNLDEYIGIEKENTQSYHYFMNFNLFDRINIDKNNTHIPSADSKDINYCKEYDKLLDEIGMRDIQILGIGPNGHLAFNEPASSLNMRTSIIDLTEETINANSRFFETKDEVPKHAISMGISDIFNSKVLIVIASGKNKKRALRKFLDTDKIDPQFPVSFIRLHPNCYLFVDKEALES